MIDGFRAPTDLPEVLTAEYLLGKYALCPHCSHLMKIVNVGERQVGVDPEDGMVKHFFMLTLSDGGIARMWTTT